MQTRHRQHLIESVRPHIFIFFYRHDSDVLIHIIILFYFIFFIKRYNEHVMNPVHHQNQDTNDRFLANIQRNGTFSVVPRIAAGEITPDGLIAIGRVAKKYGLYTKVYIYLYRPFARNNTQGCS